MTAVDRAHLEAFSSCFLNEVEPFDWNSNLLASAALAEELLRRLTIDKPLMRSLIVHAAIDPYLWSKCEEDVVEDKIVLWDDVERNLRIRLRMSTAPQERLAHNHRFSFSNLVLRGSYTHWIYQRLDSFDENTRSEDVREVMLHEDVAGDFFTIHHNTLHSTPFIEEHTISLVLRGNPIKERAPVMFKEPRQRADFIERDAVPTGGEVEPSAARSGDMFWRIGENSETKERRVERQMSLERHAFWLNKLEDYGII